MCSVLVRLQLDVEEILVQLQGFVYVSRLVVHHTDETLREVQIPLALEDVRPPTNSTCSITPFIKGAAYRGRSTWLTDGGGRRRWRRWTGCWIVHLQVAGAEQTLRVLVVEFGQLFWVIDDTSRAVWTEDYRRCVHLWRGHCRGLVCSGAC